MNIICLDTETTGLDRYNDEILQLSIIDGEGTVLFNEYLKPSRCTEWSKAERVHHIKPSDVENCKTLLEYKDRIQEILSTADIIVGYNLVGFDLPMLFNNGIESRVKYGSITVDLMLSFAEVYGEYNHYRGEYKWQKLQTCASYYSYDATSWHDALDDAKATLYCFYKMYGNPPELPSYGTGIYPSIDKTEAVYYYKRDPSPVKPSIVSASSPASPKKRKKTGRVMIGFGIFFFIGFFTAFNPIWLVIAAVLLYFGIRRHKAFKSSLNENGKPE